MSITSGQTVAASDFVGTSSGASDSGKVAKLNASGQFAKGFIKASFGGDGTDGALSITSGTTTIDCANAAVVIKNYTSISITSTGKLAFSNPATNGTTIVLKSQGNVTITSTATCIDASAMGAAAGTDGYGVSIIKTNKGTDQTAYNSPGAGGAVPSLASSPSTIAKSEIAGKYPFVVPGAGGGDAAQAGGGGGASTINTGNGGNNGANASSTSTGVAGRGGGVLIIECAGAWNFTTASGISVAGQNATATSGANGGGKGGGGSGLFMAFYNTLTANSGTVVTSGGTGATGSGTGGSGGNGGVGYSLVAANTEFV